MCSMPPPLCWVRKERVRGEAQRGGEERKQASPSRPQVLPRSDNRAPIRKAFLLQIRPSSSPPTPTELQTMVVAHIASFLRSWATASLISSPFKFPCRSKKACFVHSRIHLAITGECFTYLFHSCLYSHAIT